ncbi:MAG: hypothetical protein RLZZ299_3112 [Pseudomonadota bacterium]|jgi:hypothetical protein
MASFDVIGDVHGHLDPLERLLHAMGYRERDGAWRHPDRTAVFVGDLIDRGPSQREVLALVRRMQDAGSAHVVLGNHEFNAIGWATERPGKPGTFLRGHSERRRRQHAAFLEQVGEHSASHREIIGWFRTLPAWLELPGLRVIHACWHPDALARVAGRLSDAILTDAHLTEAFTDGSALHADLEVLLKGLEAPLPSGFSYADKEGTPRHEIRIQWWRTDGARNAREVAIAPRSARLPDTDVDLPSFPADDDPRPCVVGHYWLDGTPARRSARVACVDYSVAAEGRLCAYRFSGETEIQDTHFESVPRRV